MKLDINFTSSNRLWVKCCFAFGLSRQGIGEAEAIFPNFFIKAPLRRVFLDKLFEREAYEKIKLEDDKDVEVQMNLDSVNFN